MLTRTLAALLGGVAALGLLSGCAGAPPQIVSLDPVNGKGNVPVDFPVRVAFDRPIERGSIAPRLHITPGLSGCDPAQAFAGVAPRCRVVWSADSTSFVLEHRQALFTPDVKYHFALDSGVRDVHGAVNGLDHGWELTAAVAPTLSSTAPSDGSRDVSVDTSVGINFSAVMDVARTQASIQLRPAVAGTRVLVNSRDHARFVVLPGHLLAAHTAYTVVIGQGAVEEHGARVVGQRSVGFTTGTLQPSDHALVLARRDQEAPSVVLLTGRSARQPGEPATAATVLEAPVCSGAPCGRVVPGGTTEAFLAASLNEGGSRLAVVVRDLVDVQASDRLELVDLGTGQQRILAFGASDPAWSADGQRLAFQSGDRVQIYDVRTDSARALPVGDRLDAPPAWSADGSMLALPVVDGAGRRHVELADPALLLRYPTPGFAASATAPVLSADGSQLAVRSDDAAAPGTWLIGLRTADAAPHLLGADLTPIGFVDAGTLLAVDRPQDGPSGIARVSLSGGDIARLGNGPRESDLATVTGDVRGRTVGFLLPDAAGVLQAWTENADGSNPVQVTGFASGPAGYQAAAISLA